MADGAARPDTGRLYTERFWAKAQPYGQRGPERIHLLEHHLADIGSCMEELLRQPLIRKRLARAGGSDDLDPSTVARLCVFAALHDIGKVNLGFQSKVWLPDDLGPLRVVPDAGHTLELAPVLTGADTETEGWFFGALGWDDFLTWDDRGGETVSDLLVATLSHHGAPLQLEGARHPAPQLWRPLGALDPAFFVRRVGDLLRRWFPGAWNPSAPPLPAAPAFQHMFLGLCTLADWLGSNEGWFPFQEDPDDDYITTARRNAESAVSESGLAVGEQRRAFRERGALPAFSGLFPFPGSPPANAVQEQAALATPLDEQLVVIESETGSGKTEAALWRFARMYEAELVDGIYFALPTRAAATQIHERITRFARGAFPVGSAPPVVLAVPGYLRDGDATGRHLPNHEILWDDDPDGTSRGRRWATERSKRYLAAQVAVGTVDQAMLAALQVKHSHLRAACLARNLLVVDEVHASDTYMRAILRALLDAHLAAGGYAVLMSATLGSDARREWLSAGTGRAHATPPLAEAIRAPYPAVSTASGAGERIASVRGNGYEKSVLLDGVPLMDHLGEVAGRALEAARSGAKVLVVRNTVSYAIRTQQAVEEAAAGDEHLLFGCGGVRAPHHGRFARGDRGLLDREVERRLGRERAPGGLVVVGTQTLEQSLDIDADLLITDLCPADVLLQRIGRLHRHRRHDRVSAYQRPRCLVLLPRDGDLTPLLSRSSNGLGRWVYDDLRILEATRRLISTHGEWAIPRMNRELVEMATHPEVLEAITDELGVAWREHAHRVIGGEIADGLNARSAIVRRDRSFCGDNTEVLFASQEERIRTRLGDEGIELSLKPAPEGPFGAGPIESLIVPARWLHSEREEAATPDIDGEGFTFRVGAEAFRYDRLGLRHSGQ